MLFLLPLLILAVSCSRTPYMDDEAVSQIVSERIGADVQWHFNFSICDELIRQQITPNSAIQIALLNNPKVQAVFEDIGIAHANLIEAGLLSNPSYELEVRYPTVSGLHTNIEYLITSSILDIFLIPLRTRLATSEFEQTKLKVSKAILDLAFEVRETHAELVYEIQRRNYSREIVELMSIMNEILSKQYSVGNVNILPMQIAHSHFLEAKIEYDQSEGEIIRLKEKMNRLLGLPTDYCLIFSELAPITINPLELDLCLLESIAFEHRLDLQISKFEIMQICQRLGLKDWWTYTDLSIGIAGEREPEGTNVIGPGFTGKIPVFNYGQAARKRLRFELNQAQHRLNELEIFVASEVREAHQLVSSYARMLSEYRERLLPLQQKILFSSEELYNVMGLGVDKLLETKRQEFMIRKAIVNQEKKCILARVQLDRALGGNLSLLAWRGCR